MVKKKNSISLVLACLSTVGFAQTEQPTTVEQREWAFPVSLYASVSGELLRNGPPLLLPASMRQVRHGQTWANTAQLPNSNLALFGLGLKRHSGFLRPAGGVVMARTFMDGKLGANSDVRSSSIPQGQTTIAMKTNNDWQVGFFGELNFGLSPVTEGGFGYRETSVRVAVRLTENGQVIQTNDIGSIKIRSPYARFGWQPSWMGLQLVGGIHTFGAPGETRITKNAWFVGAGPTFQFGGKKKK